MAGKARREQKRMEHLRRLAGIFDSPRFKEIQEAARKSLGDCWDCRRRAETGRITVGQREMLIVSCLALTDRGSPVLRALPFHCPYWEKRAKLEILEGGREDGGFGEGEVHVETGGE